MDEIARALAELDKRLRVLEEKLNTSQKQLHPAMMVIYDKEHDRINQEMDRVRHTYSSHQTWSKDDKEYYARLRARRTEIRKSLGIII